MIAPAWAARGPRRPAPARASRRRGPWSGGRPRAGRRCCARPTTSRTPGAHGLGEQPGVHAGAHEDHAERRSPDPQLLRHAGRPRTGRRSGPRTTVSSPGSRLEPLAQRLQARHDVGLADGAAERLGDDRVEIADRRHHSAPGVTALTAFWSSGVTFVPSRPKYSAGGAPRARLREHQVLGLVVGEGQRHDRLRHIGRAPGAARARVPAEEFPGQQASEAVVGTPACRTVVRVEQDGGVLLLLVVLSAAPRVDAVLSRAAAGPASRCGSGRVTCITTIEGGSPSIDGAAATASAELVAHQGRSRDDLLRVKPLIWAGSVEGEAGECVRRGCGSVRSPA